MHWVSLTGTACAAVFSALHSGSDPAAWGKQGRAVAAVQAQTQTESGLQVSKGELSLLFRHKHKQNQDYR